MSTIRRGFIAVAMLGAAGLHLADLRGAEEDRPLGVTANQHAYSAYYSATYALYYPGGYSDAGVNTYVYALYAYYYGIYAGDSVKWGGETTRAEALAGYFELRYGQYVAALYAQHYGYQRYVADPGPTSLGAFEGAYLAMAYAGYDLGF